MNDLVSVVLPTHNRKDEILDTLRSIRAQTYSNKEVIVVSDSDDGTRNMFVDGGEFDEPWVRFYNLDERVGITQALNMAIEKAEGEYIFTLDDDSFFSKEEDVTTAVETFKSNPRIGLLGFRVVNDNSEEEEFPGWKTNGPGLTGKIPFISPIVDLPTGEDVEGPIETTYFPGCGYAVRGTVYDELSPHPDTFDYGAYEDDLAFRIHKSDYTIQYLPGVTVRHKRSPDGALPQKERLLMSYTNNVAVAVRHLPWRYVVLNVILWGGATLVHTDWDVVATTKALLNVVNQRDIHLRARDVLDAETISHIKKYGGRLY